MYRNTYFPTTIVDGFFDNPDAIRAFALSQNFTRDPEGRWPGMRTECISQIAPLIFDQICQKTLSLFFSKEQQYGYKVDAYFQLVNDDFKSGWVHKDPFVITSIIYLTPGSSSGTSLYIKKNINFPDDYYVFEKNKSYKEIIDDNKSRELNNQHFTETIDIKGLYNRLIVFDSNIYHAAQDFFGSKKEDSRLTLVCFFRSIIGDLETPIQRSRNLCGGTTL